MVTCWRCGGTSFHEVLAGLTWRCTNPKCQAVTIKRPDDLVPADLSQTGPNA